MKKTVTASYLYISLLHVYSWNGRYSPLSQSFGSKATAHWQLISTALPPPDDPPPDDPPPLNPPLPLLLGWLVMTLDALLSNVVKPLFMAFNPWR